MVRIQWQNIVAPDIGASAVAAQAQAGQALDRAFSGFTNVLDQYEGQRREANLAELVTRQNAFAGTNDVTGYAADLADGDLTRGLTFLRAGDLAAARGFTNDLRTGRNAEASFARGQTLQTREDEAHARAEADRASGILVAREANSVRQALSDPNITAEQRTALTARLGTLAATVENAGQINDLYSAGRSGQEDARRNENWDRDAWRYGNERQNREWTVQDRNDDKAAEALITKFREYGPNITADDVIGSDEYRNAPIGVRASVLAAFQGAGGGGGDTSFAGPSGGGSTDPNASWAERIGLVGSESGGSLTALNKEGYGGRLQFGQDRLADAARAGIIPAGMTGAAFSRQSADVQRRVEDWHFQDIDRQASRMGLDRYIGQTIAGVPINQNSIRAMAHLGGIGGVETFIKTGGRQDPADSNGTRLSDYGRRFNRTPADAATLRGQGNELSVTASVTQNTDRNNQLARTVVPLMSDRRDNYAVAQELTGAEGKFKGLDARQVALRIRGVQDMYRRETGGSGELSAAAAAQVLANNLDPYSVGDFFGGLVGRRGSIGRNAFDLNQSIDLPGVRSDLAQLRPTERRGQNGERVFNGDGSVQTYIPLADQFTNDQNLTGIVQGGQQGAAQVAEAKARYDAAVEQDRLRRITNNPSTNRLRREYLDLERSFSEGFVPSSIDTLRQAGQFAAPAPPPRRPAATGPAPAGGRIRPREVVYGD